MVFGLSEPTVIFCFLVALVKLVAAVISTFQIYLYGGLDTSSRWCIGYLVSTVHWTSRLDGALDVSDIARTLSKGPKES